MAGFSPQDSYCIWGDMGDWGGGGGAESARKSEIST